MGVLFAWGGIPQNRRCMLPRFGRIPVAVDLRGCRESLRSATNCGVWVVAAQERILHNAAPPPTCGNAAMVLEDICELAGRIEPSTSDNLLNSLLRVRCC